MNSSAFKPIGIFLSLLAIGMLVIWGLLINGTGLTNILPLTNAVTGTQEAAKNAGDPLSCSGSEAAVLMYHYVRPEAYDASGSSIRRLSVPPEVFETQIRELKRLDSIGKIKIIPLSDLSRMARWECISQSGALAVAVTIDDAWSDVFSAAYPLLKKYEVPFSISTISRYSGKDGGRYQWFATRDEISQIIASGYGNVISHSLDHRDFGGLSNPETQAEICDSKRELESAFASSVSDFVFPAGHIDAYADTWLKKCGYVRAYLTKPGKIRRENLLANPYSLPRLRVTSQTNMDTLLFGSKQASKSPTSKHEKHLQAR